LEAELVRASDDPDAAATGVDGEADAVEEEDADADADTDTDVVVVGLVCGLLFDNVLFDGLVKFNGTFCLDGLLMKARLDGGEADTVTAAAADDDDDAADGTVTVIADPPCLAFIAATLSVSRISSSVASSVSTPQALERLIDDVLFVVLCLLASVAAVVLTNERFRCFLLLLCEDGPVLILDEA
jgi:hypothetical protein